MFTDSGAALRSCIGCLRISPCLWTNPFLMRIKVWFNQRFIPFTRPTQTLGGLKALCSVHKYNTAQFVSVCICTVHSRSSIPNGCVKWVPQTTCKQYKNIHFYLTHYYKVKQMPIDFRACKKLQFDFRYSLLSATIQQHTCAKPLLSTNVA